LLHASWRTILTPGRCRRIGSWVDTLPQNKPPIVLDRTCGKKEGPWFCPAPARRPDPRFCGPGIAHFPPLRTFRLRDSRRRPRSQFSLNLPQRLGKSPPPAPPPAPARFNSIPAVNVSAPSASTRGFPRGVMAWLGDIRWVPPKESLRMACAPPRRRARLVGAPPGG